MNKLINPRNLMPKYKKWQPSPWMNKTYLCLFTDNSLGHIFEARRKFRRATEAEEYGRRLHARWVRLYDAAVMALAVPSPVELTA